MRIGFMSLASLLTLSACAASPTFREGDYSYFARSMVRSGDYCLFDGKSARAGPPWLREGLLIVGAGCEAPNDGFPYVRIERGVDLTVDELREALAIIDEKLSRLPCEQEAPNSTGEIETTQPVFVICLKGWMPSYVRRDGDEYTFLLGNWRADDLLGIPMTVARRDGRLHLVE